MTIEWLEESNAERLFKETLVNWHENYAYSGCHSAEATEDYVRSFFRAGYSESPTANALMNFIEISPTKIYVVGMRGGFQCFNSTEGPGKDMPVIFIDVDGKLEIFVRSAHGMQIKFGPAPQELRRQERRKLNRAAMIPASKIFREEKLKRAPWMGSRVSLDNRIAALHEFGHAKQYLERPHLFDPQVRRAAANLEGEALERSRLSAVKGNRAEQVNIGLRHRAEQQFGGLGKQEDPRLSPDAFAKSINAAALKMATKVNQPGVPAAPAVAVAPPTSIAIPAAPPIASAGGPPGAPPPPPGPPPAPLMRKVGAPLTAKVPPPAHLATKEELAEVAANRRASGNWGRVIEMDNMSRHEWPICREIGVPYRTNYRDLDATTTAEASLTSQIIRAAPAPDVH